MESATQIVIYILTLIAAVVSLTIPIYCIPAAVFTFTRRSPYSPWPLLLVTLCWVAQWPAILVLAFTLPNAPGFSSDGQESLPFDLEMFSGFVFFNALLFYWVYRHRRRFLPEE